MEGWQVQILIAVLTVAGSFLVAWFTAKHQLKKDLLERRFEIYRTLFEIVFELKGNSRARLDGGILERLLDTRIDAEVCGTAHLVKQIDHLIARLKETLGNYRQAIELREKDLDSQAEFESETNGGDKAEIYERFLIEDGLDGSSGLTPFDHLLLQDEEMNFIASGIAREMRRSLGYKEFRPAVWFRGTKLYEKARFWV